MELVCQTEADRTALVKDLSERKLPFSVVITDGKHRTLEQNKLQRLWCKEIAAASGMDAEEVRGYLKLHFGVPILSEDSEDFREKYESVLGHLPYADKLALMMEPFDLPVTRIMKTKQKSEYLNRIHRHFAQLGISLTLPKDPDGIMQHDRRAA